MARERYVRHDAAPRTDRAAARARAGRVRALPAGAAPSRAAPAGRATARAALACAALLATGAGAAAATDLALVEATPPCCEDPARFGFQPLPERGSVDFAIDRSSPLFEFQSGKSFFHAFRLPTAGGPYTLELRSFLEDPDSPRTARVFFPVMAILTDDFLVSRATDLDALRFDLPVLEQTTAPAYRVQLPVNPANTRERYLVVFTPAELLAARGVQVTSPETAAQAARSAYLGAAAFGRLRITLRPSGDAAGEEPAAGAATPPGATPAPPPDVPPAASPPAPGGPTG